MIQKTIYLTNSTDTTSEDFLKIETSSPTTYLAAL